MFEVSSNVDKWGRHKLFQIMDVQTIPLISQTALVACVVILAKLGATKVVVCLPSIFLDCCDLSKPATIPPTNSEQVNVE